MHVIGHNIFNENTILMIRAGPKRTTVEF